MPTVKPRSLRCLDVDIVRNNPPSAKQRMVHTRLNKILSFDMILTCTTLNETNFNAQLVLPIGSFSVGLHSKYASYS